MHVPPRIVYLETRLIMLERSKREAALRFPGKLPEAMSWTLHGRPSSDDPEIQAELISRELG